VPRGFDAGLSSLNLEANETILPLSEWTKLGVTRIDGGPLPRQDIEAALILPQGIRGPAFVVYENYRTILKYNRSTSYAVSIGALADQIAGGEPLQLTSDDKPLSREDMITLQEGLISQQFLKGKADGILGAETRQAVRRFQRARGLPPDGYADRALIAAVTNA
jgi:membrane-bound lytic murein transglycosylase B